MLDHTYRNTFIFVKSYIENVRIKAQKIEMPIETHLLLLEDKVNCKEKQQKKLPFNNALPKDPNCPAND